MKKVVLATILILILATSLVKNSTKAIEDKISTLKENITSLRVEFSDAMLEYNYLSSPEKLIDFQSRYFEKDLIKIDITEVKKLNINGEDLKITNFKDKIKVNE